MHVGNPFENEDFMKGVTMAKEIPLTQGKVAIVSDEDYEWLLQWKWYPLSMGNGRWVYVQRGTGSSSTRMHRAIMGRYEEIPSGMVIDHINGDTLDNRRENLRIVSVGENVRNQRRQVNWSSSFRGVSWNKKNKSWQVVFDVNEKTTNIGFYESPVIAAVFANDFLRQRDGVYARLNDIPVHVEQLARQIPPKANRRRTQAEIEAQREHAAMVDAVYAAWQAAIAATARPSATANESATSAEEQAA